LRSLEQRRSRRSGEFAAEEDGPRAATGSTTRILSLAAVVPHRGRAAAPRLFDTVRARMRVGVPRETAAGERRVALVPEAIPKLAGISVAVERGAGVEAGFPDAAYGEAGADLVDSAWEGVDGVVKVAKPSEDEVARLRAGELLIAFLQPLTDRDLVERLAAAGVLGFAMESIPRTTRAQPMDALSSQATVAGYKGVLLAAERLPRFSPMLTTAAGTIAPARVLVLGAGVAGLQALATARRLGAVVSGFDVRPSVREQVQSLGATFLDLGVVGEETEGGYARELTPEEQARQQRALEERIPEFDVVITTAAVPGRPAPRLIPAAAVERMRPGSVIVDLAAETGGNCELTRPGETADVDGVAILGPLNLASTMPTHASQLYARNVSALLGHLAPEGDLRLDWEDEITAGTCVTRKPEAA
jgi:NAD(P) transhydrogenase subunit alpha